MYLSFRGPAVRTDASCGLGGKRDPGKAAPQLATAVARLLERSVMAAPAGSRQSVAGSGPSRSVAEPALTQHDNSLSRALYCLKSSAMWAWAVGFSSGSLSYAAVMVAESRHWISRKRGTRFGVRTRQTPSRGLCLPSPALPTRTGCRGYSGANVVGRNTHWCGQSTRRVRDQIHRQGG